MSEILTREEHAKRLRFLSGTVVWAFYDKDKDGNLIIEERPDVVKQVEAHDAALRAELAAKDAEIERLKEVISAWSEWHHDVRVDERVNSWVHQFDYGLYSLLMDGPYTVEVDLDANCPAVPAVKIEKEKE